MVFLSKSSPVNKLNSTAPSSAKKEMGLNIAFSNSSPKIKVYFSEKAVFKSYSKYPSVMGIFTPLLKGLSFSVTSIK